MRLKSRHCTEVAVLLTLSLGLSLGLSACSSPDAVMDATSSSEISATASDLGQILVDGNGDALYIFVPDAKKTVSCVSTCTSNWPPLRITDGAIPEAGDGLDASLLGSMPSPDGSEVVTYAGWPLYRYAADRTPGEHRGQNINLNGGRWLVMQPDGNPLE